MVRNADVPELLERFMEETGKTEQWVTVSEFRQYFGLDIPAAPAIAGFLTRIYRGPFFSFPYRVERVERLAVKKPHHRIIKRYLVKRRPFSGKSHGAESGCRRKV